MPFSIVFCEFSLVSFRFLHENDNKCETDNNAVGLYST